MAFAVTAGRASIEVSADERAMEQDLRRLFADLDPATASPQVHLRAARAGDRWRVLLDGQPVALDLQPVEVGRAIAMEVKACFRRSSPNAVLHAAAIADDARRVIALPAGSGSGKSTLAVTALRAGFGVLTDEALDVGSPAHVTGCRAPLVLRGPAHDELIVGGEVGTVHPDGTLVAVVFPQYREGSAPQLQPIGRAAALERLADHCPNLWRVGRPGIAQLTAIAADIPAFTLVHGDAAAAVPLLRTLLPRP